jgi:hypothetical protein
MECDSPVLIWISIGACATVIISKFASPRRGRYTMSFVMSPGCAIIHLVGFLQRYYDCNWNFLVCDQNEAISRSPMANEMAQKIAAFDSIYRFCAQMLLYLVGGYTLAFKQHLAWNTLLLLTAHYNIISLILFLCLNSGILITNLLSVLALLAMLLASELLNRIGRKKAQELVSKDSENSQECWKNMIDNNPNFRKQIVELKKTINGSSLVAVCEHLDPKTKNLVPRTVLQTHADIDRLYRDCSVLNYFFQDWVQAWFSSGTRSDEFEFCNPEAPYKEAFKIHVANCFPDVLRGPIKAPNRVISKVVWSASSLIMARAQIVLMCILLCARQVTWYDRSTARTAGGLIL